MTRAEHLQWCKDRALAYLEPETPVGQTGDRQGGQYRYADGHVGHRTEPTQAQMVDAWASMVSDLGKHPGTTGHMGIQLGQIQLMAGLFRTADELRRFINGFN